MATAFEDVYSVFLSKITDDMYMELTRSDTETLLQELLYNSLSWFEFPRQDILGAYDSDYEEFTNVDLTNEEIEIITTYMIVEWLGQQLASVENTRMKYSGSDFKFTSQANHMAKLESLKDSYQQKGFHLQRLYKRREKDDSGIMRSTFGNIMKPPSWEDF